jgi:hypothetical protein
MGWPDLFRTHGGSVWCAEWKPQATHISLGVSQGALLFDISTSNVRILLNIY